MDWLTGAVIAAIALFVAREFLELIRRKITAGRQAEAFKIILKRECELNAFAARRLHDAIGASAIGISGCSIIRRQSGAIVFALNDGSSWPLPRIHLDVLRSNLFGIATLDEDLFRGVESAYDASLELDHVRTSFIAYLEREPGMIEQHFEGFRDYGAGEIDDALDQLNACYRQCANGQKLEIGRIR